MVGRFTQHLLRRHVSCCAEGRPGLGAELCRTGRRLLVRLFRRAAQLGESEIQNFDPPGPGDEQVLWLEVAMDNSLVVGGCQALKDLERVFGRLAHREQPAVHALAQGHSLQQLRDHEGRPLVRPHVEDRQNVGMVEDPGGARFQLEPVNAFGVVRELGRENLDRHLAAEAAIEGAIDLAHPAGAKQR